MARPPLALDRLEQRADGHIVYRFKKPWRDGTHAVVLSPQDFIARLCALVPPPRFHLLRYLGVLSAHASLRAEVVPGKAVEPPTTPTTPPMQLPLLDESAQQPLSAKATAEKTAEPSRLCDGLGAMSHGSCRSSSARWRRSAERTRTHSVTSRRC